MRKPSAKQRAIIKMKVAGKTNRRIAPVVYPDANPRSAEVMVSQQLHTAVVQKALEEAYKRHNLTPDRLVKPISEALDAEKVNDITGEITIDHATRLKAANIGLNLIGARDKPAPEVAAQPQNLTFIQVVNDQKQKYGL